MAPRASAGQRNLKETGVKQLLRRTAELLSGRRRQSSEEAAYRRLATGGYAPGHVIDVGAYHGDWTRTIRSVFPEAPVLMVEAQQGKSERLRKLSEELKGVDLEICALAAESGRRMKFYEMETGSSLMPERSDVPRREITLVTRTLDEIAERLSSSIFLKLDVQGAELEVLKGGMNTLQRCSLVQLELAFVHYNEGAPTLLEAITFMDSQGFTPFDITNLIRPSGATLVQADFLFCPATSPLRPNSFSFGL